MRKIVATAMILVLVITFAGCTSPTKNINGIEYRDYGLFTLEDRNPNIHYEPNWLNIIIAALLVETIIIPIYVFGFHLMEPTGPQARIPGQIPK